MIKKVYKQFLDESLNLRDRILRFVIVIGEIMATIALIEGVILNQAKDAKWLWLAFIVAVTLSSIIMFKYKKTDIAAIIIGISIICVVFPSTFFVSGGLNGGATVWMCLGVIYIFLMFKGKLFFLFSVITMVMYFTTYYVAYTDESKINRLESKEIEYIDSMFSVIWVGILGGIIIKVQENTYNREKKINENQKEAIKQIINSKENFFASVSHEIRTPINTILGLNEMILRENISDSIRENAENIQSASELLLNLINDVIDLSQLEVKEMEIFPIEYDLKLLVKDLVNMIHIKLKQKNIEFYVDIDENLPTNLFGDEKRIKQVMLNILSNAAKYTKTGSVTFTIVGQKIDNKLILLKMSVKDTGVGIKKEDIPILFEPFKRIEYQKNANIQGTGLGLSIAKQMVEKMGGEISVDSIYTKGSTFTVTLEQGISNLQPVGKMDFMKRRVSTSTETYRHQFESPEAKILVVDDNEMNLMVVKKLLRDTKVQVDTATSGKECLELTKLKYYNLILMDHLMPEMDGVMTLKEIRKQENSLCKDIPAIVLTANVDMGANNYFRKAGFDAYLEKPIRGEKLEKEILKFLSDDIIEYRRDEVDMEKNDSIIQVISQYRKKTVLITTDNICDISNTLKEKYNIQVLNLYIKTENGRFCDNSEINSDSLSQMFKEESFYMKADSASVEEYEDFFAEALTKADDVIHISMSGKLGVSYQRALKAAKGFDHVRIVDSEHISGGQALLVLQAAKMVQDGASVTDIVTTINNTRANISASYMLPHARLYEKNGYATKTFRKITDFFKIKPIMKMRNGKLYMSSFGIGKQENMWHSYMKRYLKHHRKVNMNALYITYVGLTAKQIEFLEKEIKRTTKFENIYINKASVSTACNAGIGTLGFAYYTK